MDIFYKVPDDKAHLLENYVDKDVFFGVRPEDLTEKSQNKVAEETNTIISYS